MHIYKFYPKISKLRGQPLFSGFCKGSKSLLNIFKTVDFCYQLKNKKCSSWQYLSKIIKIFVTFYVIRDFRCQNRFNFGPLYLESEKILKNIIDQKLLRIMLSTKIYTFRIFSNGPFSDLWVRPLKITFQYISKTIKNF